ncbi:NADP-dependent oxidoreductase [Actinomadura syzygii]|uniref:NADP-dependent oxidoreductase n=1 Tax=Actinomadura syzygii TaxID=1427538 RepID=A0A5D0UD25_9ACTN|nr:NADP-dependent oxidoreductase [Actinomadura syzygii]TYC15977.1 NADP-dependent oxidoreductase [Actinomadura syzygii]
MKVVVAPGYVPVEDLVVADQPRPEAGPGQVLIKLKAAALNPLDVKLSTGVMKDQMPVDHPFALGLDAAGTVEALGEGVQDLRVGDEVIAFTYGGSGALAEYALANAGPTVVRRPAGLDPVQGAALPVAAMTAAAVITAADVPTGGTLLIVGATGGVGSFAVQLAAQAGVKVLATATRDEADYVRGLGAKEAVDYTAGDVAELARAAEPGGVDAVIDLVNFGPGLAATAAAAKPGGRIVSTLGGPPSFDRDVTAVYTGVEGGIGRLDELVGKAAGGTLAIEVSSVRPFSEAVAAVVDFAAAANRGKTVITF